MTKSARVLSLTDVLGACSSPEHAPTTETPAVAIEAGTSGGTGLSRPGGSAWSPYALTVETR